MRHVYHCPSCRGPLRRLGQSARALDFFCGDCRLAVSVVDEHWAQIMRPSDLARQLVPVARVRVRKVAAESSSSTNGTGPLAC